MFLTPNRRYVTLAGAVLFLEWTWVFLCSPGHKDILASLPSQHKAANDDIFDYGFVQSAALKDICDAVEWNNELIFTCDNNSGSVADVKNSILNCLRFAIAAGGLLVAPRIIISNSSETSSVDSATKRTDFSSMFDLHHFLMSLHLSCPQLITHKHVDDVPPRAWTHNPLSLRPEDLQSPFLSAGIPRPETWGAEFHTWLGNQTATRKPTGGLTVVNLARSLPVYPVSSDEDFAHEFGMFLKIQPDARVLATLTFHALIRKYNFDAADSSAIARNAYVGAYLGSDGKATDTNHSPTTLAQRILNETLAADLTVLYLASTDPSSGERLAADASPLKIQVTSKFDLLPPQDAAALQALAPEQQALVDYLVLGRASQFMGVGGDAFGWSVALGRGGKWSRDGGEGMEGELMRDSLSRIYGKQGDDEFASCLWP
ncbi:hypothetical protein VC83_02878 [Pseudogymnoascus destructans]|uniref:Uncharacterized protein n=2 Tax=Pseudogymnoascus destructans TaxID=655981 RepID=L8FWS5_PSED2|nr:uncharacterized protein VC83_02878 [Pseudogymnoascus destructans]ELR04989.1 hypothetical protein GMDG_00246 [Pseudogymnoascus destructans 20631-21]OAF60096.1 hypothetical protein VC83_02878 [Pseudogymnoascus destructans]